MCLSQYRQISVLLLMAIPLLFACGESEEDAQKEVTQVETASSPALTDTAETAPVENTMQDNIEKQKEIEQEATSTLDNATVEAGFDFETQHAIHIDLHFEATQFQEKISIYSTVSDQPNTPESLLEQGTIIQGSSYKSKLTAPSLVQSFMIVRNDDFSTAITLTLNSNALLTHTFLE